MSDEKAPTDWAGDVKRYVPDADDGVIAAIVRYCGIALRTRDAAMVSFTDKVETGRVRENFCKKKLAIEESDAVIDAAIAAVGERMSDTKFRNRVTVYYLLAEHFDRLGLFVAKNAKGSATAAAAVTPIASLAAAAPLAAAATFAEGVRGAYTLRPIVTRPLALAPGAGTAAGGSDDGFFGLAAAVFGGAAAIMIVAAIAGSYIGGRFDAEAPAAPAAPAAPVVLPEPIAPVIPDGAGIVSEMVEGRPKISVFFDVSKNAIAPEFTAAVAPITAWLDANPGDRVRLSGFTDPTGNAAANAELAKNRAQAVAAALAEHGIPAERMDLIKPEDSSDEMVDLAGARRVEITVTGG